MPGDDSTRVGCGASDPPDRSGSERIERDGRGRSEACTDAPRFVKGTVFVRMEHDSRGRSEDLHPIRGSTAVKCRGSALWGADPPIRRTALVRSGSRGRMRQKRSLHRRSALRQRHGLHAHGTRSSRQIRGSAPHTRIGSGEMQRVGLVGCGASDPPDRSGSERIERDGRGRSEARRDAPRSDKGTVFVRMEHDSRGRSEDLHPIRGSTAVKCRGSALWGADPPIRRTGLVRSVSRGEMRQKRSSHGRSAL